MKKFPVLNNSHTPLQIKLDAINQMINKGIAKIMRGCYEGQS